MKIEKIDGLNNIYSVDGFWIKLKKLFHKNTDGYKLNLIKLRAQLIILDSADDIYKYPSFEHLVGTRLSAIRSIEKQNLRVIFVTDKEKKILLISFFEKNRSDYQRAISLAEKKLMECENDDTK
ncbi:MAG: hypothetical protein MJ148_01445 [Clostridia bacterium]|nr:hypothetical protein [Clostridia bacterium]